MRQTHPEALLISAVLRQGDHVTPMARGITDSMFHVHRREWKWIERYILRRHRTPSTGSFRMKFPDVHLYEVDDVDYYCDEVKQSHIRHSLLEKMDGITNAIEEGSDLHQILGGFQSELVALQTQVQEGISEADILTGWEDIYSDVRGRVQRSKVMGQAGIPTGFPTLDARTGGPGPGDYWVVAARLGEGKTWTTIRMACAAVYAGHKVQYFSLEQSRTQVALRAHSIFSSNYGKETFKNLDLNQGRHFSLRDYKRFLRDLPNKLKGSFIVNDQSRGIISPLVMAGAIEQHRPDIVFVDYLTLLEKESEEWASIAALSGQMKLLASRYQVPIVVLAQINRQGIGRQPPGVEHLAQSDRIGQDADVIVTLKQVSDHTMKMRLAKHRHGQGNAMWWVKFAPNSGDIEEIDYDQAMDIIEIDKDGEDQ